MNIMKFFNRFSLNSNLMLRLLTWIVIAYMLVAFGWWSILLFTKNSDAFEAKTEQLRIVKAAEGNYVDETTFRNSEEYQRLYDEYMSQQWMIFGEATFFVISLIIAIYFINSGYNQLVESSQQQRNFLLSITHELKSPLASIRLGLETMDKRKLEHSKVQEIARDAIKETDRLHNLVNNLLMAAKLESNYEPAYENTDVRTFLREKYQAIENRISQATVNFDMPDHPLEADIDPTGMTSLFNNLVENAYKYSEDKVRIDIIARDKDENWQLIIADQGIGIDKKEKLKVTKKFYRVGSEDTRRTKGTGLGLYIIETVVKAHHGAIEIEDNEPQGSRFIITIPKTQSHAHTSRRR